MSPRPAKPKHCGCPFKARAFKPTAIPMHELEKVTLLHEELEALRLCDLEALTQQQAGERMGVSRGTVQRLLSAARRKTAYALVNTCALVMGELEPEKGEES